ncbi:MAG: class C sortase [Clostridiales bacterium]|nr:class C sortase [Clostridiales bacterium]
MKRKLVITAIVLMFAVGIGVLSYPLVSSIINNNAARSNASLYDSMVDAMDDLRISDLFDSAETYNSSLTDNVILTDPFDESAYEKIGADYEQALDVDSNGLIGYVDIPKINVYLPIYHGTSSDILDKGAGHLQNTSLPVGGESTHAVISAHTGYPGETFFDYLTDLEVGDVFYIHVLNETLKYEVDQIKVVLPEETEDLRITEGEDYVTLLTCTPYGVNTHRLLVRGTRADYDEETYDGGVKTLSTGGGYLYFFGYKIPYWATAAIIVGFVALVIFIVIFAVKRSRKKSADGVKPNAASDKSSDEEAEGEYRESESGE